MFKIIGLVGKMQSGKTTVSGMILDNLSNQPAVRTAFANHLKEMIFAAGLCTADELWTTKTEFSRLMMQKIGTEIIRKQVDPNFWIKKMVEEINTWKTSNPENLTIVIDEVRFINEAAMVKMFNGILIKIVRPSIEQNKEENKHLSEIEQDLILPDFEIINDGNLEELQQKVKEILTKSELVK
jgi:thymidine kinase